nr:PASTA domain-containing protein [Candidatus Hydrogenedentota bacterium]
MFPSSARRIRFMVPGLVMVCLALLPGLAHALSISIATLDDLNKIGRDPAYPLDGSYVLTADIDASATQGWNGGAGFEPIGTESTPFTGTLDGQGHVIQNLYINRPDADYVGLFGYTGSGAQIQNIGLEGGSIMGGYKVGGLVGGNYDGTLTSCYATGSVTATGDSARAGGLVGLNSGTLTSCYATGSVSASGNPAYAGGLVGYNWDGDITSCYATGSVTPTGDSARAGGLVGANTGTLTSCYATGMVAGDYVTGGLVGWQNGGTLTSCYWDVDTTGQSVGVGHVYGGDTAGGTGLATTQMKQQASFAGWDFTTHWTIQEGQTYPYFPWQAALGHVPVPTIPPDTTEQDARNTLAAAGFVPGTLLERWSDTVPAGQVVDTIPAGGTVTAPGGVVDLVISRGPKPVIAIASLDDLNKIGRDPAYPRDVHYVLTADIDASTTQGWNGGAGFEPIGTKSTPFTGTLDGQGHVIRNLYINRPDADYVGLFGVTGGAAEIRNLGLEGGSVTGREQVGSLVGRNWGTLTSCYATGAVSAGSTYDDAFAGGLVGNNDGGTLTSCYATGSVTTTGSFGNAYAGGLVGRNSGTLTSCYATGTVTATTTGSFGSAYAGGLVGYNSSYGTLTSCYATGAVTVTGTDSYGNALAGGLVGGNRGTLTSCYATGAVTTSGEDAYAGGLVGDNDGTLTSCYATGAVTTSGEDAYAGGLVGYNGGGTLTSCYATGMVAGDYVTGGLVGYNWDGTLTSCYWDVDTTGQSVGVGHVYGGGTAGGTGLATTQMKQQASFAGWDFTTHWTIQEGQTYPYFPWQA